MIDRLPTISWYVGEKTETSIRSGKFVSVKGEQYMLPSPQILSMLHGTAVTVSHIPAAGLNEVYLYEGDKFICTCKMVEAFNESQFERTQADVDIMHKQLGYMAEHDKMIRDHRDWVKELKLEMGVAETIAPNAVVESKKEPTLIEYESEEERLLIEKFGRSN